MLITGGRWGSVVEIPTAILTAFTTLAPLKPKVKKSTIALDYLRVAVCTICPPFPITNEFTARGARRNLAQFAGKAFKFWKEYI